MSFYERWSIIAAFAAIAVNIIAFVAVIGQLRLLARQNQHAQLALRQDHERRRKQATLEFYSATHDRLIDLRACW